MCRGVFYTDEVIIYINENRPAAMPNTRSQWRTIASDMVDGLTNGSVSRDEWICRHAQLWQAMESTMLHMRSPTPVVQSLAHRGEVCRDAFENVAAGVDLEVAARRVLEAVVGEAVHTCEGCVFYTEDCLFLLEGHSLRLFDFGGRAAVAGLVDDVLSIRGHGCMADTTVPCVLKTVARFRHAAIRVAIGGGTRLMPFVCTDARVVTVFVRFVLNLPRNGALVFVSDSLCVYERDSNAWACSLSENGEGALCVHCVNLAVAIPGSVGKFHQDVVEIFRDVVGSISIDFFKILVYLGCWTVEPLWNCGDFLRDNPERRMQFTRAVCEFLAPLRDDLVLRVPHCGFVVRGGVAPFSLRIEVELKPGGFAVRVTGVKPESLGRVGDVEGENRFMADNKLPAVEVEKWPRRLRRDGRALSAVLERMVGVLRRGTK
jgi:hypothetical protein